MPFICYPDFNANAPSSVHKSDKSEKEGAARPAKVDPVLRDPAMLGHHGSAFVGGVEATENMKKEMRGAP